MPRILNGPSYIWDWMANEHGLRVKISLIDAQRSAEDGEPRRQFGVYAEVDAARPLFEDNGDIVVKVGAGSMGLTDIGTQVDKLDVMGQAIYIAKEIEILLGLGHKVEDIPEHLNFPKSGEPTRCKGRFLG